MKELYKNAIPLNSTELQECVLKYKTNPDDLESLSSILSNYTYIGKSYMKKHFKGYDEDFISELIIKVMEHLEKYNTYQKNATFKTYFYLRLNGFMYDYLRKKSNNNNISLYAINKLNEIKKKIKEGTAELDEIAEYEEFLIKMGDIRDTLDLKDTHVVNTKEESMDSKLITEEILRSIKNNISNRDYFILENYSINNNNFTEIGKMLNISKQAVRKRYLKTINKIKGGLLWE